jgi:5-methylcytosine-specific restriction endonuclease McrA
MLSLSRLADGVRKAINDYVDAFDKKIKNNTKDVKSKKFSEADRDRIFKNYYGADAMEGKCILCPNIIKNTGSGFEVSHIHPKMYGGGNEYDNLMPLCSKCNRDMGSNHYYSYLWKKYGKLHDKWDIIKV